MQANWHENFLTTQVGYFSHINAELIISHSDDTSCLGRMSHLICYALSYLFYSYFFTLVMPFQISCFCEPAYRKCQFPDHFIHSLYFTNFIFHHLITFFFKNSMHLMAQTESWLWKVQIYLLTFIHRHTIFIQSLNKLY